MAKNPFDEFDNSPSNESNPFDEFDKPSNIVSPSLLYTPAERQSLLDAVGSRFEKAKSAVLGSNNYNPLGFGYSALVSGGQLAGAVNDVIAGPVMNKMVQTIVPDPNVRAEFGQFISEMPGLKPAVEAYGSFKEEFPKTALGAESALNIASVIPQGMIAKKVISGIPEVASNIGQLPRTAYTVAKGMDYAEEAKTAAINKGFQKFIRPSYSGKSDASLSASWYKDANIATRELVDRYKHDPLSKVDDIIQEFSNRNYATKNEIWKEVKTRSSQVGNNNILVDMKPVFEDLWKIGTDPDLMASNKSLAGAYIEEAKNIMNRGQYVSPESAETMLAQFNGRSSQFWKDPKSHIDALATARAANSMRQQLFKAMGDLGSEYADLRMKYGSILGIERDVQNRATQYGRRNQFGFFDLGNMVAAKDFVIGLGELATGNPTRLFGTAALLATKKGMQGANDAADGLRKMFKNVEFFTAIQDRFGNKLKGDVSGIRPTPQSLPMPERGFTTVGEPYSNDIIQARFTSRPMPLLGYEGQIPEQLLLPPGERGFSLRSGMGSGPGVSEVGPIPSGNFYPPVISQTSPMGTMVNAPVDIHTQRLPVSVENQGIGFTTRPTTRLEQFLSMEELKKFMQERARKEKGVPTKMKFSR